jgi:hypothetical protein
MQYTQRNYDRIVARFPHAVTAEATKTSKGTQQKNIF